jgi:trans-aconitate methyltransferase
MESIYPINSKEYWDWRFESGSWSDFYGEGQTRFFAEIMIDNLPSDIFINIYRNNYSMLDFGMGLGQLCDLWSTVFETTNITGLDLSEVAVKKAIELFPDLKFTSSPLSNSDKFDIVVSSNTLEHLKNWREYLDLFSEVSQKYIIILVPHDSGLFDEHVVNFDINSFPETLNNFEKVFEKVIKCNNEKYWNGLQQLVIYKHT